MFSTKPALQRITIPAVTAAVLLGTGVATAAELTAPPAADTAAGTVSNTDPNYAPSAVSAAGVEKGTRAGSRPQSGSTPKAGPTFTQGTDKVWDVNTTQAALRNTVTDADGEKSTLTFEVWTVGADGKPAARVKLTDANEYGVLVSDPVASGKTGEVKVDWGKLKRNTSYMFRTSAFDGSLYETDWSPWATFKVEPKMAYGAQSGIYGQVTDNTDLSKATVTAWLKPSQTKLAAMKTTEQFPVLQIPADKIKVSGNQLRVDVDPATVGADYKTENGLIQLDVQIVDPVTKKMTFTTASATATGDANHAWADLHALRTHRETGTRAAAAAAIPEFTTSVDKAASADMVSLANATTRAGGGEPKPHMVQPIKTADVPATIGSSYPVGDSVAWMTHKVGTTMRFGAAFEASGATGWSASGSAETEVAKTTSMVWAKSGEPRVYRANVRFQTNQHYIDGKPLLKSGEVIRDNGMYTDVVLKDPAPHTPENEDVPDWRDDNTQKRCNLDKDPASLGEWTREKSTANTYSLSTGLKVTEIIGITMTAERQYSKSSTLNYEIKKGAQTLCGNDELPAFAGKVANYHSAKK
ncbi:hypothetical protein P8605_15965 [Streptomyces sp. T-3]|nr:hypothetical protein [Streptomyces sp. T-3]